MNHKPIEIKIGVLYFFVHLIIEVISFSILFTQFAETQVLFTAILFDLLAFGPQGLLGKLYESHKNINIGYIGMILLVISIVLCNIHSSVIFNIGIVFLGIGNALLHELAAIDTVTCSSNNKILSSTLFVGGGSFGLCLGKLYKYFSSNLLWLLIVSVIGFILIYIADSWRDKSFYEKTFKYPKYEIVNPQISAYIILICVLFTTTVRGFIAYTIPTNWCNEVWEICIMYTFMGTGKALGGYFCDKYGYRITAILSTLISIPFLIFGNDNMLISVFGIFLFSMTMGISFAMGLSVMPESVALPFGITTIGLILGTFLYYPYKPVFMTNVILICIVSIICAIIFGITLRKNKIE